MNGCQRQHNTSHQKLWDILSYMGHTQMFIWNHICKSDFFFMKTKLLSIKMEANESVSKFISHIKDMSDKLGDICEKLHNIDLVTITLKGLVKYYKFFISSCSNTTTPYFWRTCRNYSTRGWENEELWFGCAWLRYGTDHKRETFTQR